MKKGLIAVCVLFTCLCLLVLSSCTSSPTGSDENPHVHTNGTPVIENRVDPTCEAEGYYDEVIYCSECNAEVSRTHMTVSKAAHSPSEATVENEISATCDTDGSYEVVIYCSMCSKELSRETKVVKKTDHAPSAAVIENKVKGLVQSMKVLIVGGGGREHAIAMCVSKSAKCEKLYCAPGNAGIAQVAECAPIGAMEFDKLVAFAKEKEIDFVIVGMDDPLVGGLVDKMEEAGIKTFGPKKNAAILEGSKAFSKDLMKKYNIPTAAYENFDSAEAALAYLETADGEMEYISLDNVSITLDGQDASEYVEVKAYEGNAGQYDLFYNKTGDYTFTYNGDSITVHVDYPQVGFYNSTTKLEANYVRKFEFASMDENTFYVILNAPEDYTTTLATENPFVVTDWETGVLSYNPNGVYNNLLEGKSILKSTPKPR